MTVVDELVVLLGLKVENEEFKKGEEHVSKLQERIVEMFGFHEMKERVLGLFEMTEQVAELGEHAIQTSQKVGVSVEAIQELGYAAKFAGIQQETLETSLGHLNKNLTELAMGKGEEAAQGLKLLGVSAQSLKGKSPDEALAALADAFQKMPDGAAKTTAAMDLFGKSGRDMIPLLNKGSAGMGELRKEAVDLGAVMSKETAEGMESVLEDQKKLSAAWQGVKIQIVSALVPALKDLVGRLLEWLKAHKQIIAGALERVVGALTMLFGALADAIGFVLDVMGDLDEGGDTLGDVLIALGAIMLAFGAKAAVAWLMALGPIDLIIIAIAAIGVAVSYLIHHFDKVRSTAGKAWSWIVEKAEWMGRGLKRVGQAIAAPFIAAFDFVKESIEKVIRFVKDSIAWIEDKAAHGWLNKVIALAGGGSTAALATQVVDAHVPSVPGPSGGGDVTVNVDAPVTVNAGNADAQEVARIARQQAQQVHQQAVREALDAHRGGVQ